MPNVKTLEDFGLCSAMLFNINHSQLTCWCIVKIAAGGEALGSRRSRGGSVRIVFCPFASINGLFLGDSEHLASAGLSGCCSALLEIGCTGKVGAVEPYSDPEARLAGAQG